MTPEVKAKLQDRKFMARVLQILKSFTTPFSSNQRSYQSVQSAERRWYPMTRA